MRSANSSPNDTARIVKMIDCDWGQQPSKPPQPTQLTAGTQIRFGRGLMVVEFASGAEVMLEAPVDFAIVDANRGQLNAGKLTATVPRRPWLRRGAPRVRSCRFGNAVRRQSVGRWQLRGPRFPGPGLRTNSAADHQNRELILSAGAAVEMAPIRRPVSQDHGNP